MDTSIDNNLFEIKPIKSKRKLIAPCTNVYLNPALDLLANEDPMCNNAMEIIPVKKRKRTRSCEVIAFENTALDTGITKEAVNEFLKRELDNVRKNLKPFASADSIGSPKVGTFSRPPIALPVIEHSLPYKNINTRTDNLPSYNIVGLPIVDQDTGNYYDTPCSSVDTTQQSCSLENIAYLRQPVLNHKLKVVAAVEPRMNSSEPIYSNLTELSMLNPKTFDEKLDTLTLTKDIPVVTSENLTETIVTQNGMEISNTEDINMTESNSKILVQEPKNFMTVPEFGKDIDLSAINKTTSVHTNITNQLFVNNNSNINLSFIDRLTLDSPNLNTQSLCLDDDLNESNIMEIKTITIITKTKRFPEKKKNTNPFLDPNFSEDLNTEAENPFLQLEETKPELEYTDEVVNRMVEPQVAQANPLMPRRLFTDNNSTVSTMNELSVNTEQNVYENINGYRSESPIYENVGDEFVPNYEKQSKILGCDVSKFSAVDIMNINRSKSNSSNESNDSKKYFKHQILKASNKLSKKVFKTLKKTFRHDRTEHSNNVTSSSNPYEVPRKLPKKKTPENESGIENPALKLDISDETDDEDLDEEHQYETIKTLRNTQLNMNVTPLKERHEDNIDTSHNKTNTPGKKVRFDSTLNKEKVITGNSFDYGIQSPGFDAKIDKYHDELENCINEKKFLQQNM